MYMYVSPTKLLCDLHGLVCSVGQLPAGDQNAVLAHDLHTVVLVKGDMSVALQGERRDLGRGEGGGSGCHGTQHATSSYVLCT